MSEAMGEGKKTTCLKVWVSEALEVELMRLAAQDDRKLSDYAGLVLRRHVWGHVATSPGETEGPTRAA